MIKKMIKINKFQANEGQLSKIKTTLKKVKTDTKTTTLHQLESLPGEGDVN